MDQTACKPGSVPPAAEARTRRPFLWTAPRGTVLATYPDALGPATALPAIAEARASLFGLAPGGACHAVPVTRYAVGSYPTLSPLPSAESRRRFAFCGAIPGVAPGGRYPPPCRRGARTFLDPLAKRAATARPSGPRGTWSRRGGVTHGVIRKRAALVRDPYARQRRASGAPIREHGGPGFARETGMTPWSYRRLPSQVVLDRAVLQPHPAQEAALDDEAQALVEPHGAGVAFAAHQLDALDRRRSVAAARTAPRTAPRPRRGPGSPDARRRSGRSGCGRTGAGPAARRGSRRRGLPSIQAIRATPSWKRLGQRGLDRLPGSSRPARAPGRRRCEAAAMQLPGSPARRPASWRGSSARCSRRQARISSRDGMVAQRGDRRRPGRPRACSARAW